MIRGGGYFQQANCEDEGQIWHSSFLEQGLDFLSSRLYKQHG